MMNTQVSPKYLFPILRGFIVIGEVENFHSQPHCCYSCDLRRSFKNSDSDYIFSIVMFGGEADYRSYFRDNPSLRIIEDAEHLFNLYLEYSFARWLETDIRIAHFAFSPEHNCYVMAAMHSFPPSRGGYKSSIQAKNDVLSCIKIEKCARRTQFGET